VILRPRYRERLIEIRDYDRILVIELGHVTERKPPFHYAALARVAFSDTDAQGVVYYGRYMPYFDLARVEYHRSLDMLRAEPQEREFVMRAMTVEYHAPARFDDPIEVDVRIERIGTSSVTYDLAAYLEGETLAVTAKQTLVLVDLAERKPCPVPDWWRARIREFEGDDVDT
jgi:acyl-CoA thioester hydrolase